MLYSPSLSPFPSQGKTLDLVQFTQNEAAFSVAVCTFASRSDTEWYVVVGTATQMTLSPRTCSGGSLVLFKLSPDGSKLEHVHTVSKTSHSGILSILYTIEMCVALTTSSVLIKYMYARAFFQEMFHCFHVHVCLHTCTCTVVWDILAMCYFAASAH